MFCPRCATQNFDDARFCRACGADISLVPQALTGLLTETQHRALAGDEGPHRPARRKKREKEPLTLRKAYENIFEAFAFLIIFLAGLSFYPRAYMIWIWFIIPALSCAGAGIGLILDLKREQKSLDAAKVAPPLFSPATPPAPQAARLNELLPPRETSEIIATPATIAEGTTRHLER